MPQTKFVLEILENDHTQSLHKNLLALKGVKTDPNKSKSLSGVTT